MLTFGQSFPLRSIRHKIGEKYSQSQQLFYNFTIVIGCYMCSGHGRDLAVRLQIILGVSGGNSQEIACGRTCGGWICRSVKAGTCSSFFDATVKLVGIVLVK
jgi:hypothetical protein